MEAVDPRTDQFDPQGGAKGQLAGELALRCCIVENTTYRWKSKFPSMEISDPQALHELEHKNARLNRLLTVSAPPVPRNRELHPAIFREYIIAAGVIAVIADGLLLVVIELMIRLGIEDGLRQRFSPLLYQIAPLNGFEQVWSVR